jgi:antitoxin component of MazEF toxin-antitoxin module
MQNEIREIGNSDGVILPRDLMQRLDLKRGQLLHVVELPGGCFQALPTIRGWRRRWKSPIGIMDEYQITLAALRTD